MSPSKEVVAVVGAGAIGTAIARRVGAGRKVLLAGHDEKSLDATAELMRGDGHEVTTQVTDVSQHQPSPPWPGRPPRSARSPT